MRSSSARWFPRSDDLEGVQVRRHQRPDHPLDNVVDIGEIPLHFAVIEDVDGLPFDIALVNSHMAMSGRPQGPYTVKNLSPTVGRPNRWL